MNRISLRYLEIEDQAQFNQANNSHWADFHFAHYWESIAGSDFNKYVNLLPQLSKGLNLPDDHVPCTLLFAFNEKEEIVGRTSIRHQLTDDLLKVGGHIGYGVVPQFRKLGYATVILKESLNYIRENLPLIQNILITCDQDNIASQKTIEKNNGILENIFDVSGESKKMRYWIKI